MIAFFHLFPKNGEPVAVVSLLGRTLGTLATLNELEPNIIVSASQARLGP